MKKEGRFVVLKLTFEYTVTARIKVKATMLAKRLKLKLYVVVTVEVLKFIKYSQFSFLHGNIR